MPTIRDVARAANVSTSTVSHVINETRFVSPETRQRVLDAMHALNYSPNRLASSLRSSQTLTLGVLLPNSANPFFAEVLAGIENAGFDLGYNIIMGNANDDPVRELAYLRC
jgi:LacI family transcriptional regulator